MLQRAIPYGARTHCSLATLCQPYVALAWRTTQICVSVAQIIFCIVNALPAVNESTEEIDGVSPPATQCQEDLMSNAFISDTFV